MSDPGCDVDAVVVGAGFNGLYQLYRLREAGFRVRLLEAEDGVGGVWQSNRYPGARVDSHMPNYQYSIPEVWQDWSWSERFPGYRELRRYFEHVVDVLELEPDISLSTRVTEARFDDTTNRWTVRTDVTGGGSGGTGSGAAESVTTQFLVLCTGFASKPYVPNLSGLESFAGDAYHSARWPEAGVSFADRRVGVIGTGASGVQIVQEAAVDAAHLVLFQRTPVMALPMQQRALSAQDNAEAKQNYADFFERRNTPPGSFADIERLRTKALDATASERERVFEEAWEAGGFHFWAGTFADIGLDEAANRTAYDFWRDKTRARIDDPATAELLAPTDPPYPFGTKRPSLEQNFYDLFNQPNVELVDLHAEPIGEILPEGVRAGDRLIELDVLALATGFDANTGGLTQIDIRGTDDRTLRQVWSNGVHTSMGVAVHGFPNMILLYGPQSPTAFCNGPTCAELQGEWVVEFLDHLRARQIMRFESTPEADAAWVDHLDQVAAGTLIGRTDSWYMAANIPGKKRQLLNYPSTDAYLDHIRDEADAGYPSFTFA